jgi:hypothetical protein
MDSIWPATRADESRCVAIRFSSADPRIEETLGDVIASWATALVARGVDSSVHLSHPPYVEVPSESLAEVIFEISPGSALWKDLLVSFVVLAKKAADVDQVEFFDRVGQTVHPTWP